MLLSPHALKSLISIEKIQTRIICASFNGNPCTTIISCYSASNATSYETDIITFFNTLYSLVLHIPKQNILIIGEDMNAQIGSDKTNKFCLHNSANRIREYLADFSLGNWLACLNSKFPKKKVKLWTYTYPYNFKARLDYILINNKWINRALNCEAYLSFEEVSFDHKIVSMKICLSLFRNKKHIMTGPHLSIEILAINIRWLYERNLTLFREYLKHILQMKNMKTSSLPIWKQQLSAYQPN